MKATVFTIFFILSAIVNVCAQKANVTISEPTYVKGRTGTKLILGEKNGKIFVVGEFGSSEKDPKLFLESYDAKNLKKSASNKIEFSNDKNSKFDFKALVLEDKLYLSYVELVRKDGLIDQPLIIPIENGVPKSINEPESAPTAPHKSVQKGNINRTWSSSTHFKVSSDSSKLIIYTLEVKKQSVLNIVVYDNSLKKILKKEIVLDDFPSHIAEIDCDKEQNIIVNANNYGSPASNIGLSNSIYALNAIYFIEKNGKKAEKVLISEKDCAIRNLRVIIDDNKDIVLVGLYKKSISDEKKELGSYFLKISSKSMSIIVKKMEKFSPNIMKDIVNDEGEFNFSSIKMVNAKLSSNGSLYLITESCTYGDRVLSEEINTRVIFLHCFSSDGEILWDLALPRIYKETISSNPMSFTYNYFNDKLFLFYYENPDNLTKVGIKNISRTTIGKDSYFVMVAIDEDGKWKKHNLGTAFQELRPLQLDNPYRTADGSLIFISGKNEREKLVKITLTN